MAWNHRRRRPAAVPGRRSPGAVPQVNGVGGLRGPELGLAVPAAAAPPGDFRNVVTFPEIDPCTGEDDVVTIVFEGNDVTTRDGRVWTTSATITTALGYEARGTSTDLVNPTRAKEEFHHVVRNADTGNAHTVRGSVEYVFATDEFSLDIRPTCIGDGA
jgi:hypothetical protein